MIRFRFEPARRGTVIGCGVGSRVSGRAGDVIEIDVDRKVGGRLYVDYLVETIPGLDGERCLIPVVEDQPAPPVLPPPRVEAPIAPPAPAAPEGALEAAAAPRKRGRKPKATADAAPAVEDDEDDDENEDAGPAPAAPEGA